MEKTATLTAPNAPALDDATRDFVRASLVAGVLELDDIKKVVVSLLAESPLMDRDRLAAGLVGAGLLTSWQSKKLAEGYTKGLFLGSYKLLRPLGRGGMGVVYLGEHRVMKRPMALKVLLNAEAKDNRRIDAFKAKPERPRSWIIPTLFALMTSPRTMGDCLSRWSMSKESICSARFNETGCCPPRQHWMRSRKPPPDWPTPWPWDRSPRHQARESVVA